MDLRFRRHRVRWILAWAGTGSFVISAFAQMPPTVPTTVTQQVFRSRWVGPQADLPAASTFARPAEEQEAKAASEEPSAEDLGISPFLDISSPLRRGITVGPVKVHPSLALGWEYSDQNDNGQATSSSDTSSLFAAPSIGLDYDRAVGPWTVAAAYGAGLQYYFNPNYTSSGTSNQRNPISQTASLQVGHRGARHKLSFATDLSYGTGYDINTGGNVTQTNINAKLGYQYVLTSHSNVGAEGSINSSQNSYGENNGGNGNVSSFAGNTYWDWVLTGKTRFRFTLGAGTSSQTLEGDQTVNRNYVQSLVSVNYKPKGKFTFDVGFGVGYLTDPGTQSSQSQQSQYVGARSIYEAMVSYKLTDKTSLLGRIGLQGTDIRPTYRLEAHWQPRLNTGFSLAVYQDEGFSLTSFNQVQVSRGAIGIVTQRLFSRVDIALSAGWQQTEYLSLSNSDGVAQNGQTNSYGFASADVRWKIRDWLSWQATIWASSGGSTASGNTNNSPETRAMVSLNLTL